MKSNNLNVSLVTVVEYFNLGSLQKAEYLHDKVVLASTQKGQAVIKYHKSGYQTARSLALRVGVQFELYKLGMPCPRPLSGKTGFVFVSPGHLITACEYVSGSHVSSTYMKKGRVLGLVLAQLHELQRGIIISDDLGSCCNEVLLESEMQKGNDLLFFEGHIWNSISNSSLCKELIHRNNLGYGLVHCDIHLENVIMKPNGDFFLLDFDLCHFGFLEEDLANAIFSLTQQSMSKEEAEKQVIQAYSEVRQVHIIDEEMINFYFQRKMVANQLWLSRQNSVSERRNP